MSQWTLVSPRGPRLLRMNNCDNKLVGNSSGDENTGITMPPNICTVGATNSHIDNTRRMPPKICNFFCIFFFWTGKWGLFISTMCDRPHENRTYLDPTGLIRPLRVSDWMEVKHMLSRESGAPSNKSNTMKV